MHHALPFEPELEQVAVDHQRRRAAGQRAKEGEEQSLGLGRGVTEMHVGDDVAGRGEHAVSLLAAALAHKPAERHLARVRPHRFVRDVRWR